MRRIRLKKGMRRQIYREDYLKTPHWRQTRAAAIARAGGHCQMCGAPGPLEVHHLTYERLFAERPEDLLALCRACHEKIHNLDGLPMIDTNSAKTGARFIDYLDRSLLGTRAAEPSRHYLGASVLGENCERKIQYHFFHTTPDEPPTGQRLRILFRGRQMEEWMAAWIASAGFRLTERQRVFSQLQGRIQGHADGVIFSGPSDCGPYPRLWENKALGHKSWSKLAREGLKKAAPQYFGQLQLYMAYLELDENPALFTAINADTMEILALDAPFEQEAAQALSDRALRVIRACEAGEQLPRCAKDSSWYECKMCQWKIRCWETT